MHIRSQKDFASGIMFVLIGLGFAYVATTYPMGTPAKMGPGYFPFWLGILLAMIGAIVTMTSMSKKVSQTSLQSGTGYQFCGSLDQWFYSVLF